MPSRARHVTALLKPRQFTIRRNRVGFKFDFLSER
jgi:hypothetical protein